MKYIFIISLILFLPLVLAQETDTTEDAGLIGPENPILHAFDRVADNIVAFLSRIGGADNHANAVRRIVAERRAEHVRLLQLKNDGEITPEEFAKWNVKAEKNIEKKEQVLINAEAAAEKKAAAKEKKSNKKP